MLAEGDAKSAIGLIEAIDLGNEPLSPKNRWQKFSKSVRPSYSKFHRKLTFENLILHIAYVLRILYSIYLLS